jgi:hypothetical protein
MPVKEPAMEDPSSSLEIYLGEAQIDFFGAWEPAAGGGHAEKQLVVYRGGVGALAKLGRDEASKRQCRAEVGAYEIARVLGWDDLVPVTVYRKVPTEDGTAEASVQVEWPSFATAQELGRGIETIDENDALRIAVLDVLLMNGDRNAGNWGFVRETKLALIDHGNTGLSEIPGVSEVANARRDQNLNTEHLEALRALVEAADHLTETIGQEQSKTIVERATRMLESGTVAFDG